MLRNRKLTELKNIGKKIASRLEAAGISTEDDLREAGAVGAYHRVKTLYPDETLPVCYYLYAFEGALTDTHWDGIGDKRKRDLKMQIG